MKLNSILFAFSILFSFASNAQQVKLLSNGTKTSLRGLSVVDDNIIWASGSNGMIAKSTNGGNSFTWIQVPNFEKRDFRDIEAFDSNTAIIIAIAEPAQILKTIDGGKNWKIVFTDSTKGMFLDAISFYDDRNGIVVGDPINNVVFITTTTDGGNTWKKSNQNLPILYSGEAFFASSGSNIIYQKKKTLFVSGGKKSNLYFNNKKYELPIVQGLESTGANSIAAYKNQAIIVGGDFAKDSSTTNNCVLVDLKTMKFTKPITAPNGYRSCVVYLDEITVISCGLNGIDISKDGGLNWSSFSREGFHVVAKAKKGNTFFLAGSKGRIAKFVFNSTF
ncbi:MAG: WD40/YVTN/BNR-like repeat-containing protein [Chitinophagaceae bacterium]